MSKPGEKLAAILNPSLKRSINESELQQLQWQRGAVETLKNDLKKNLAELEALENSLIARLKAGARIYGKLTAVVDSVKGPSRPHYKEELCQHMLAAHGQDPAVTETEVQQRWPGSPVERVAVSPKQQSLKEVK